MNEIKVSQVIETPDGKRVCIIPADDLAVLLKQARYELDGCKVTPTGPLTYRKRLSTD